MSTPVGTTAVAIAIALICVPCSAAQDRLIGAVVAAGGAMHGAGASARLTVGQKAAGRMRLGTTAAALGFASLLRQRTPIGGVGIDEESETSAPERYELQQNYPNPFNPVTTIAYGIPDGARVSITVYDGLGRRVATLVDEVKRPGYHEVQWDARSVSSGVYLYVLRTGSSVQARRMVVLK